MFQEAESAPRMSYPTFSRIWRARCRDVVVQKPRSDVRYKCDTFCVKKFGGPKQEQTVAATKDLQQHLAEATQERQYYNNRIAEAKKVLEEAEGGQSPTQSHITFDFAQQLELPQHTRQVGPLYFKSRFRVQVLGICNEARKQQINYLFHEGETIGVDGRLAHGANAVISMLDSHFANHIQEKVTYMNADNCVGQNKNQCVMGYMWWRVVRGLSEELHLSFMRVGHTRCSVDGYFGLMKIKYRSSEVDSMEDVDTVVNTSCSANSANRHSWPWHQWDARLKQFFKAIPGIIGYQHFRVSKNSPGKLFVRKSCGGDYTELDPLRPGVTYDAVKAADLTAILPPGGLSLKRLGYLHKEIQPYLREESTPPWTGSACEALGEEEQSD